MDLKKGITLVDLSVVDLEMLLGKRKAVGWDL
jgi:hypothetical protein